MRRIVAGLWMSLDGVTESPPSWQLPFTAEMGQVMAAGLAGVDAILLGRNTYLEFAELWPKLGPEVPMSDFMNGTPKYVVSSTLENPTWAETTVLRGPLAGAVRELKERPGGDIQVPGSPRLVASLLAEGLLDELSLMVHPVVAGAGRHLFDGVTERISLGLAESRVFGNGVAMLTYRPA